MSLNSSKSIFPSSLISNCSSIESGSSLVSPNILHISMWTFKTYRIYEIPQWKSSLHYWYQSSWRELWFARASFTSDVSALQNLLTAIFICFIYSFFNTLVKNRSFNSKELTEKHNLFFTKAYISSKRTYKLLINQKKYRKIDYNRKIKWCTILFL